MENCTIYSHQVDFEKVYQIIKKALPDATIKYDSNKKIIDVNVKLGLLSKSKTIKVNCRQRKSPSYQLNKIDCPLAQNLAGMVNFIQSIPSTNESIKDKFLFKVMAVNSEISFSIEPELSTFISILKEIAQELDAFIFTQPNHTFNASPQQHFVDKNFNLILDVQGNCTIEELDVFIDAKYHDQPENEITEDQLNRKAKSEYHLAENKVKINKNLPCIESFESITIRDVDEIVERAYALLVIAAKGEGVEQKHLDAAITQKNIIGFSPEEKQILELKNLTDANKAYATWRYESLNVLLWVLGKIDNLAYPDDICNVEMIVKSIYSPSRMEFEENISLRPKHEILDKLDEIYRMHWAVVDARIKGEEPSGNLVASVIYERHYALNWLTNYQGVEWDDVRTDT